MPCWRCDCSRFSNLLGAHQLGMFLWDLLVRKSYPRLTIGCLFSCIYCWVLKLCMSVHIYVLCSWRNSPLKSKAKFFSLLPKTSDRLIRKSNDSNKMGRGVHSWDFAAYKMIALLLNDCRGTWRVILSWVFLMERADHPCDSSHQKQMQY